MWGDSENRAAIIVHHKMGNLTSKIFTAPKKVKISKVFVYWTFKRLTETETVVNQPRRGYRMQYQDQETGSNGGGPYSVKSVRAEHIQDVHVWCIRN